MTELRIGDQLTAFDRELTVAAYSAIAKGDADCCSCQTCRNFALQRKSIYPDHFRDFLSSLGIDWMKEGEAVHYASQGKGHSYGGWFYFTGELLEKGHSRTRSGEEFEYWIGTTFPQPPEAFRRPVISVEFLTILPWLLGEPYDAREERAMSTAKDIMRRYSGALQRLAKPST